MPGGRSVSLCRHNLPMRCSKRSIGQIAESLQVPVNIIQSEGRSFVARILGADIVSRLSQEYRLLAQEPDIRKFA